MEVCTITYLLWEPEPLCQPMLMRAKAAVHGCYHSDSLILMADLKGNARYQSSLIVHIKRFKLASCRYLVSRFFNSY